MVKKSIYLLDIYLFICVAWKWHFSQYIPVIAKNIITCLSDRIR